MEVWLRQRLVARSSGAWQRPARNAVAIKDTTDRRRWRWHRIASTVWRATWTACHPRCRCKFRRARGLPICRAKSPIGGRACEVWRVLLLSRGRSLAAESLPDCRADRRQQPCDAPACSRFSPTQGSGVTTTHCKHRKHVFGCPALPAALSSHLPAAVKREVEQRERNKTNPCRDIRSSRKDSLEDGSYSELSAR